METLTCPQCGSGSLAIVHIDKTEDEVFACVKCNECEAEDRLQLKEELRKT